MHFRKLSIAQLVSRFLQPTHMTSEPVARMPSAFPSQPLKASPVTMGGFSRACQSSTQKTTHVYKPFPKNINKNHVLNMSQHESTSITYPPRNFLTGIIFIMLVQGNFPTGKIKIIKNHRDFSSISPAFPQPFQECWSARGAERDGVLRLRHLDPRSDELPGELRGSGIPRDPSVSLGADEPRHAMKMGDLM